MRICLAFLIVGFTWSLGYVQTPAQPQPDKKPRVDAFGDPLPPGAVARLGTVRWRQELQVETIAFAPDGKTVASAGPSLSSFTVWDAVTGLPRHQTPNSWHVNSLAYSPDSKLLVVAGVEGALLFGVESGKEVRKLDCVAKSKVKSVAFSSDGKTVAVGGTIPDGRPGIVLLDVHADRELQRIKTMAITVAFSPDGKTLASGSDDQFMRLWEVETGKELRQFEAHAKGTNSIAFSADGKTIASAGKDFIGRLWSTESGKLLHELKPADDGVVRVCYSPNGKFLATRGHGGELRIWDAGSGKELRRWRASNAVLNSLAFSPDGSTIASGGGMDQAIRFWETDTGQELRPAQGHTGVAFGPLVFSPDGSKLTSSGMDKRVVQWDVVTGKQLRYLVSGSLSPAEDNWTVCNQVISSDAKILARAGLRTKDNKADPSIRLWDLAENKELGVLLGHTDMLEDIRFSPDDKFLASLGTDGVRLWDVALRKQIQFFPKSRGRMISTAGKLLMLYKLDDPIVRLVEVASGKEIRSWDTNLELVSIADFSPDGKSLLTAGFKGNNRPISIWAVDSGKELVRFPEWGSLAALTFSPNGRVLALFTRANKVLPNGERTSETTTRLCDAWTGQEIRKIDMGQAYIRNLTFSPDGSLLASGGADSTILLWDATGRLTESGLQSTDPTANDLPNLWADLQGDAPKVDRAIWALAAAPALSVPFLKERIQPLPPADGKIVAKLFDELASDKFAERQTAFQDLEKLGESAEAAVRKHMEGKITLEARQRLQQFLDNLGKEIIRKLHAIETLEHVGTAEARQILQALAKESPNPRVVEFATAALTRLAKRGN